MVVVVSYKPMVEELKLPEPFPIEELPRRTPVQIVDVGPMQKYYIYFRERSQLPKERRFITISRPEPLPLSPAYRKPVHLAPTIPRTTMEEISEHSRMVVNLIFRR